MFFCQEGSNIRVRGEFVQVVVLVEGVMVPQVDELLQGLIDEDDADERGEGLLGEARDVTHQGAGVGGHQDDAEHRRPQADAGPQRQIGQAVLPGRRASGESKSPPSPKQLCDFTVCKAIDGI